MPVSNAVATSNEKAKGCDDEDDEEAADDADENEEDDDDNDEDATAPMAPSAAAAASSIDAHQFRISAIARVHTLGSASATRASAGPLRMSANAAIAPAASSRLPMSCVDAADVEDADDAEDEPLSEPVPVPEPE